MDFICGGIGIVCRAFCHFWQIRRAGRRFGYCNGRADNNCACFCMAFGFYNRGAKRHWRYKLPHLAVFGPFGAGDRRFVAVLFKALQKGDVNKVVPVDKCSTVLTIVLAALCFNEPFTLITAAAVFLTGIGTLLMIEKSRLQKARLKIKAGFFTPQVRQFLPV